MRRPSAKRSAPARQRRPDAAIRILSRATEDEVIAELLRAEFQSPRHRMLVRQALRHASQPESLLTAIDLENPAHNRARAELIQIYKGLGGDYALFTGFPDNVTWWRAVLPRGALGRVHVIKDPHFQEMLGRSRKLPDVAQHLHRTDTARFAWIPHIVRKLERQQAYRPILVGASRRRLVILDGHVRLTSWMLAKDGAPAALDVLIGFSPDIRNWDYF